jgi:ribonuclease HI
VQATHHRVRGLMTRVTLRTDGGARGNPGPAGAAFVLEDESGRIACGGRFLGDATNNVAEYEALVWGLENARAAGVDDILVLMDSELIVKQLLGHYKVKNAGLQPLFLRTMQLRREFAAFSVRHVRREENKLADALANEAMDARGDVGDPLCGPGGSASQGSLF